MFEVHVLMAISMLFGTFLGLSAPVGNKQNK